MKSNYINSYRLPTRTTWRTKIQPFWAFIMKCLIENSIAKFERVCMFPHLLSLSSEQILELETRREHMDYIHPGTIVE